MVEAATEEVEEPGPLDPAEVLEEAARPEREVTGPREPSDPTKGRGESAMATSPRETDLLETTDPGEEDPAAEVVPERRASDLPTLERDVEAEVAEAVLEADLEAEE